MIEFYRAQNVFEVSKAEESYLYVNVKLIILLVKWRFEVLNLYIEIQSCVIRH